VAGVHLAKRKARLTVGSLISSDSQSSTDSSTNTATGGSTQATKKSRLNQGLSLEKNAKLNTGLDLGGAQTGNVTYSVVNNSGVSESGIASLVDTFTTTSKDTAEKFTGQLGTLAENKQTDGDAGRNKIVLIVVLAVVALLGVFIWKGK